MSSKLQIIALPIGNQVGYDVIIDDETASVADYLQTLDAFIENSLAPCRGCDGCCHERAPLMLCDFYLAGGNNLISWLEENAAITAKHGVMDIFLKRTDEGCIFLDKEKKECRSWQQRSFVCRTHICIAKSERAELLRQDCVNAGLDALIVALAEADPKAENCYGFSAKDYEKKDVSWDKLENIPLRLLLTDTTWQKLIGKTL